MEPIPGRYNTDGPWFKGNTHIHTTLSDGGLDCAASVRLYADAGYDFVFITDHGRAADVEGQDGLPIAAFNGVEIAGQDSAGSSFHAVGLGFTDPLPDDASFEEKLGCLKEANALTILAHPCWTGNSVEDALRHGFDGVEVYNTICNYLNGKSLATYHYDRMLEADPLSLAFSADDAHLHPGQPYDEGWIMLSAPSLAKQDVMRALRDGNFYGTQGPLLESIHADGECIRVRTSPVRMIRLTDNSCWGTRALADGELLTAAEFEVDRERPYLRLELEDEHGRLAWTSAVLRGS